MTSQPKENYQERRQMTNTKQSFFNLTNDYLLGILAGICISIGGTAFLSSDSKAVGALFFTIGLFVILTFKFNLFTGKVCYALDNKPSYILKLLVIWLGNLTGAILSGLLLRLTRLDNIVAKSQALAETKLSDNLLSIFILAIFCNILIYVAVHGFNTFENHLLKVLALFFGVSVFVLCGFEHCVANMFYFSLSGAWIFKTILYLLVMTAGNIVGGLFIPAIQKLITFITKKSTTQTDSTNTDDANQE